LHNAGIPIDWTEFEQPYRRPVKPITTILTQTISLLEPSMQHTTHAPGTSSREKSAPNVSDNPINQVRVNLVKQIAKALGESAVDLQTDRPFVEMGADSVMLAEAMRGIQASYGVRITARQLLNDFNTIDHLSVYLAEQTALAAAQTEAPADAANFAAGQASTPLAPLLVPAAALGAAAAASGEYAGLFQQQLNLVQQVIHSQIAAVGSNPGLAAISLPCVAPDMASSVPNFPLSAARALSAVPSSAIARVQPAGHIAGNAGNVAQAVHFAAFSHAYIARTAHSKCLADARRQRLADVRASAGFRPSIKELVYPITGNRAEGARMWDVDGNEYIDISMDFGVNLFGHGAPFLKTAIHQQAELGLVLGTRSTLSGEVSQMLCEMTGMNRVLFCQSGSESVMTALRLARLLRDRSKVAVFRKSYHGHFDGVLGDRASLGESTEPAAAGILPNFVSDLLVLDYCEDSALQAISTHADQLAAVLVEPVQSRALDSQPREFLQRLRELTARHGILLIFDEMITGFRSAPGGAQEIFDVEADLVTYGKSLGGGVPLAALAARGNLLDGIDGGIWRFGDDSAPGANTTFFAGTFNNHPLGFALSHAVLTELKRRGPAFQENLNERTAQLTDRLNSRFSTEHLPLSMIRFGSAFRFKHTGNLDLLYYHLLHRGLFVSEGRNCFLCDAHGQTEIDAIVEGVMDSVSALRDGGYIPGTTISSVAARSARRSNVFALSDTQKQIWLASQFDAADEQAYCETVVLEIDADIGARALERALVQLVLRHEALCTTIDGAQGTQKVHSILKTPLSHAEYVDPETWLISFIKQPFNLSTDGPLQVGLLTVAPGKQRLVLRAHHILIDGWSLILMIEELSRLLQMPFTHALEEAQPFCRQLELLHTANSPQADDFWRACVADAPPALPLPKMGQYDCTQQQQARWQGERVRLPVPAEVASAITQLATGQKTTPFTAALALTLAFFHTLFDRDDVLLGVPTHGRIDGLEQMVGQTAQIMPMRSRLSRGMRFDSLLQRVDADLETMSRYQAYSLARLLEPVLAGGNERPGSLTITFNLDRVRYHDFAGYPTKLLDAPVLAVKLDLAINLMQTPAGWLLDLDYQSKHYRHADIERLGQRWLDWVARVAADPTLDLDHTSPLPAFELQQILHDFQGQARDYAQLPTIPEQIALRAAASPEAIAVTVAGQHLDYGTLDHAARAIAGSLLTLGAGPERIVAVMLPRSAELIATILGIFYSGSAYMPIDLDEPSLRRDEILADAGPVVLVTNASIASRLGVSCPLMIVEAPEILARTAEALTEPVAIAPGDLAYVLYTSDSTNKPKGVKLNHLGLINLLAWSTEIFDLSASDTMLQKGPYTSDISVWEICLPLVIGARIVVAKPGGHRDTDYLTKLITGEGVTITQFVPAMLKSFIEVPEAVECHSLRHVLAGGEALHASLRDAFHALGLSAQLHNPYGPTEAMVFVTQCVSMPGETGPAPLGYPIANTTIGIVDSQLRPVGIGIEGDLLIGGPQLARGYLNRPDLNAESFVDGPLQTTASNATASNTLATRFYRSGDRARWREDGAVEYFGRADSQVKMRELRIEIGEIDHAWHQHSEIQEAEQS
jgi:amino acid adenylation domain-containing protein